MLTEFGGIGYVPGADEYWFGDSTVDSSAEFLDRYRELTATLFDSVEVPDSAAPG